MNKDLEEFIIKYGFNKNGEPLVSFDFETPQQLLLSCYKIHAYKAKLSNIPNLNPILNLSYLDISNNYLHQLPLLPDNLETLIASNMRIDYIPKLPYNLKYLYVDPPINYVIDEPRRFKIMMDFPKFLKKDLNRYYAKSIFHYLEVLNYYRYISHQKDLTPSQHKDYFDNLKKVRQLLNFIDKQNMQDIIFELKDYSCINIL